MKEYSSISVSTHDADALADQLNQRSGEGWVLETVVPAGTNIVALLSREASTAAPAAEAVYGTTVGYTAVDTAADTAGQTMTTESPADNDVTAAMATTVMGATTATVTDTTATTGGAPAGWYPDPAGRYELRYWDGSQWTEHVSRAGQQYTDPPVA